MAISLDYRIGFFLALRQIKRSSKWTTFLIIFVMVLTFLNLVVVSGILVGLIQGAVDGVQTYYTSDVIISSLNNRDYIENTPSVTKVLDSLPQVKHYTVRYLKGGSLEANYKTRTKVNEKANVAAGSVVGIDPEAEDKVTNISKFIVEGSYLQPNDYDQVLLGAYLVKKYLPIDSPGFSALKDIEPGTKIRLGINGNVREVTVKGILESKVDEINMRVFMVGSQMRNMIGRNDYNAGEIAVKLNDDVNPADVRDALIRSGINSYGKVQTYKDAEPKFIKDMIDTFALLGNLISSIGLAVASITIFIVIFINALTRKKFIGILKGIGISAKAIEISYVFQSIFYALIGSILGIIIVYAILEPLISAHPIDFPFSDGILMAPLEGTLLRMFLLVTATIVAGYIPARMIVRKNTLDSILGRK